MPTQCVQIYSAVSVLQEVEEGGEEGGDKEKETNAAVDNRQDNNGKSAKALRGDLHSSSGLQFMHHAWSPLTACSPALVAARVRPT